jgi:hypothetical protein
MKKESGTGKELAARAIYQHKPRAHAPFVALKRTKPWPRCGPRWNFNDSWPWSCLKTESENEAQPTWRGEVSFMPATTGMKGAGYYDEHSSTQLSSIRTLQSWLDHAAANIPLPEADGAVTVLDLGSSEGRNAIQVMASVVQIVRRRTRRPVWTFYSDLASNNFNQLFANVSNSTDLFPADVYSAAVGGSFYGPLLPPASVNLATSFKRMSNGTHRMSGYRCPIQPIETSMTTFTSFGPRSGRHLANVGQSRRGKANGSKPPAWRCVKPLCAGGVAGKRRRLANSVTKLGALMRIGSYASPKPRTGH